MRFEQKLDGGRAVLDCEVSGEELIITHTYVPPAFRGRGIAEDLTREALAWAREHHKKVVPQCSFAALFLRRHPELAEVAEVGV
jgi:predicted GNAT family acetyltransferase